MTEKKSDTWMPFYVGDYLRATSRLTPEQHGAYLLIILDYWTNGPPPNEDAVLAQIARMTPAAWRRAKPALMGFFTVRGGNLIQKRVERERDRAVEIVQKRSKAGKASAAARARAAHEETNDATSDEHVLEQTGEQTGRPSQSPSSEDKSSGVPPARDPVKDLFDLGVEILMASGVSEKQSRSLVGKWRKSKGDAKVAEALLDCRARSISEPVEWLEKRLNGAKYVSASGYEYRGSIDDVIRESERRADWSTHWRAKSDRDGRRSSQASTG